MTTTPKGAERRKFARLDLALTVAYRVTGKSAKDVDPIEALSADVSLGGFRLMTPAPLENGTALELEIELGEGGALVRAEAEVVWQSRNSATSYETGVQIKNMTTADRSRFMAFVFDQMAKMVNPSSAPPPSPALRGSGS